MSLELNTSNLRKRIFRWILDEIQKEDRHNSGWDIRYAHIVSIDLPLRKNIPEADKHIRDCVFAMDRCGGWEKPGRDLASSQSYLKTASYSIAPLVLV